MIQTQIFNVGNFVKISSRKVESGEDSSWLLEIIVEDKDGENMHVLELWSDESPPQMFRVTSNDYLTKRKPAVALMAAGMLVRQVDALSPETMRELFPQPDEDDEDFQSWSDEVTDESIDP